MKNTIIMTLSALLAAGSLAIAEEGKGKGAGKGKGGKGGGEMLKRLDKNGDGAISKSEAPEQVWTRLSKLDKNGDDTVSKEEFAAARQGQSGGAAMFEKADKNKDGKLTQDEVPQYWERIAKADLDKDGAVTKEEMAKARAYAEKQGKGGSSAGGGKGGNPGQAFEKFDKDKNGSLSESEVPAEVWSKMSRADGNGDGEVSKEELIAAHKKRQGQSNAPGGNKRDDKEGGSSKKPKRPAIEE